MLLKLSPLVTELSWSHNLMIVHQTDSVEENEFYLKTCITERWSRRELERQINASLYERLEAFAEGQGQNILHNGRCIDLPNP